MSRLPDEIFKAYDIRGVFGETLTDDIVRDLGQAIGSEARAHDAVTVVIGRDGRLSGPALIDALASGLMAAGCNVIDIGLAPTPLVYFSAFELGTHTAVALTGSHNPPAYNGLKMVVAGETLSGDRIQSLKERIAHSDLSDGQGTRLERALAEPYIARVCGDVRPARRLKVALDCGNGVAGVLAPELYRRLGCDIVELYCEVDGSFPNHHPDPSQPDNLSDLMRAVERHQCDVGLAFDGDGDRLGVVAPNGTIIWPDRQMILFARDVLERNPGAAIIFDVKCSRNLPKAIREAGGRPIMWRTGHSFIKAKLKDSDAALAGEMSGHIFFKDRWYGFDDGLYAGARLIELLSKDRRSTQEIFDGLPDSFNTPELRIEMTEGEHFVFMEELKNSAVFGDGTVSAIDGVRVDFEDGFGLVRPSNTTPMLVLRFEAETQAALARIQNQFRKWILGTRADIEIPF